LKLKISAAAVAWTSTPNKQMPDAHMYWLLLNGYLLKQSPKDLCRIAGCEKATMLQQNLAHPASKAPAALTLPQRTLQNPLLPHGRIDQFVSQIRLTN
jgi:hypothetical protein